MQNIRYSFLSDIDQKSFLEQIRNFMKISPVGAELFRAARQAERQTDMTKLIVAFRNSTKAPKYQKVHS